MSTAKTEIIKIQIDDLVRNATAEEIEQMQATQSQAAAVEAESEAKAAARVSALAKLADLGLTEAEINAL